MEKPKKLKLKKKTISVLTDKEIATVKGGHDTIRLKGKPNDPDTITR